MRLHCKAWPRSRRLSRWLQRMEKVANSFNQRSPEFVRNSFCKQNQQSPKPANPPDANESRRGWAPSDISRKFIDNQIRFLSQGALSSCVRKRFCVRACVYRHAVSRLAAYIEHKEGGKRRLSMPPCESARLTYRNKKMRPARPCGSVEGTQSTSSNGRASPFLYFLQ